MPTASGSPWTRSAPWTTPPPPATPAAASTARPPAATPPPARRPTKPASRSDACPFSPAAPASETCSATLMIGLLSPVDPDDWPQEVEPSRLVALSSVRRGEGQGEESPFGKAASLAPHPFPLPAADAGERANTQLGARMAAKLWPIVRADRGEGTEGDARTWCRRAPSSGA